MENLERRSAQTDAMLSDLIDEVYAEQERRDRLRAEVSDLRSERAELEQQQQELRQAIDQEAEANNMEHVDDEGRGEDGLAPAAA